MTYESLYNQLFHRFEALVKTSERQSEKLALALKEKNDALQRLRVSQSRLTAAQQEVFSLRLRSLLEGRGINFDAR